MTISDFCGQDNNLVVRTWGTPREEAGLRSHVDLVSDLGIVELEAGTMCVTRVSSELLLGLLVSVIQDWSVLNCWLEVKIRYNTRCEVIVL